MAKGSGPVPYDFIRQFYKDAYDRLRVYLPEEKYIVFHDGFELTIWKDFMQEDKYKNIVLDTHQYLMLAEMNGCEQTIEGYTKYVQEHFAKEIEEMQQYFPVICGEWCLFNSLACGKSTDRSMEQRIRIFLLELQAFNRYSQYRRLGWLG